MEKAIKGILFYASHQIVHSPITIRSIVSVPLMSPEMQSYFSLNALSMLVVTKVPSRLISKGTRGTPRR